MNPKKNTLAALCCALSLSFAPSVPRADDIDLYTGGEQFTGAAANVLIVLDNSTNWAAAAQHWPTGKQGESELEAIAEILGTLNENVNVGLLLSAGSNGGYVRYAIREMSDTPKPNRTKFQNMLLTMKANFGNDGDNDDKVNTASIVYDNMLNASFRYFNGLDRFGTTDLPSGSAPDLRDYDGNSNDATKQPAYPAALGNYSLASNTANTYLPPSQAAAGCAKNFIIFIGNGYPNSGGSAAELQAAAQLVGINDATKLSAITANVTGGDNSRMADEWTRFMRTYGVKTVLDDPQRPGEKIWNKITTYTIDVCKDACDADQAKLLGSMAKNGGGKPFRSTSTAEIKAALAAIFAEIQAVNSVFASATLPISVNTQGTFENQVYLGVFRPDASSRPRWFGNLKQYQFARYCDLNGNGIVDDVGSATLDERLDRETGNTGTLPTCTGDTLQLFLADRNNKPAIDQLGGTGFIDQQATSFWSVPSTYWAFQPTLSGSGSDAPDGPSVELGGAGQRLRNGWSGSPTSPHPDGRKIYTCLGTCLSATATAAEKTLSNSPFVTTNAEVTGALAAPSAAAKSVTSLTRTGDVATATTSAAHGFVVGDNVVIAGATPSAYNGTKTVLSVTTASPFRFTFAATETPATLVSGATATADASPIAISTLSFTPTSGATTTVSVTGASAVPVGTTSATITGAAQSFLNGTFTGTTVAGVFSYTANLPPVPAATATGVKAKCGTNAEETVASASWASGVFTFSNGTANFAGCKGFSGTVLISNASNAAYNGLWTIATSGNKLFTVNYAVATPVSPDAGASKTITPAGTTSYNVDITRALGATTATATLTAGTHTLGVGTGFTITGSSDAAYNGAWTTLTTNAPTNTAFTFGSFTPAPATPATGTVTATLFGVTATGPSTANLINWTRGKDLWEDENLNAALTDVRASVHADVLHSRPVMVAYGGTIGIVGFYGSNDGFLKSISGGKADTDGNERWAFIPSEFANYTKLSRLYQNSPVIRYPNSACTLSPTPMARDYFWDGQLVVYQSSTNVYYTTDPAVTATTEAGTGQAAGCSIASPATCYRRPETTILYATMRRGGRSIYALDISVPSEPKFLWKIDNTMANFSQLGFTWSEPKVAKIKARNAANTADQVYDVLVFGAGYDPTDDDQPSGCPRGDHSTTRSVPSGSTAPTCSNHTGSYTGIGRGVFVVDALTGAFINFLAPPNTATKYSFPADVALLDVDGDGYTDRIYAGDSGAQLFRFDVNPAQPPTSVSAFTALHLASFGDVDQNGNTDARKFLFPPEPQPFAYAKSDGTIAKAVMVLAGSGDREKPLPNRDGNNDRNQVACSALYPSSYFGSKIQDRFYGYIDAYNGIGAVPSPARNDTVQNDMFEVTTATLGDSSISTFDTCYGFETNCSPPTVNPIYRGWWMRFKFQSVADSFRDEEKMVSAPKVIGGVAFFGTNTPQTPNTSAGVCSNLGVARAYAIDPFSGAPSFDRNGDGVFDGADFAASIVGGGLPPSVTAGIVKIGDSFYRFVIGAGGNKEETPSPVDAAKGAAVPAGPRSRVYWFYPADDR